MTSASFKLSGNALFNKVLLKSICIVLAVACTLGQSIFGGILLFVVALFGFRRLISFLTGDKVNGTKRKISVLRILFNQNTGLTVMLYDNYFLKMMNVFVLVVNDK